jgi:hypothetical protein
MISFSAESAKNITFKNGISLCSLLNEKIQLILNGRTVQNLSKERFIIEAHIVDDAEDYSEGFYKMELNMIDKIYSKPELVHTNDHYENIRHATKYSADFFDKCLSKYGKNGSITVTD